MVADKVVSKNLYTIFVGINETIWIYITMIYKSNNNYILEDVMGDTAIIAVEQDIAKMKSMVATNSSGRAMIDCLADGQEHATIDIASKIMEEFDAESLDQVKLDVDTFLGQLVDYGYVTRRSE